MEFLVLFPDGRSFGPADIPTLASWAKEGRLLPDTLLENLGTRQRVPARSVAGIFPSPFPGESMASSPVQQMPQVGYHQYWSAPQQNPVNGMAIASLVLGIVGLIIFCFWPLSILCSLLAIIFGFLGRKDNSVAIATGGIVCGFITIAAVALFWIFVVSAATSGHYWFR